MASGVATVTNQTAFLKVSEVAELLKVWPDTVRLWLHAGKLRGVKLPGGAWRIRPEDLEALLERVPQGLTNVPG